MISPRKLPASNQAIAESFREAAALLGQQGASPLRTAAYVLFRNITRTADHVPEGLIAMSSPEFRFTRGLHGPGRAR